MLLHIIIALAVVGVVGVMMVVGTVVAVGDSFVPMACALGWWFGLVVELALMTMCRLMVIGVIVWVVLFHMIDRSSIRSRTHNDNDTKNHY